MNILSRIFSAVFWAAVILIISALCVAHYEPIDGEALTEEGEGGIVQHIVPGGPKGFRVTGHLPNDRGCRICRVNRP